MQLRSAFEPSMTDFAVKVQIDSRQLSETLRREFLRARVASLEAVSLQHAALPCGSDVAALLADLVAKHLIRRLEWLPVSAKAAHLDNRAQSGKIGIRLSRRGDNASDCM
jgi:hypothetical protein